MTEEHAPRKRSGNRRASRRIALSARVKVECRKGALGLGPNLLKYPMDISATGARLVLNAPLESGQEAEVILSGGFGRALKRCAYAVWCVPTEGGHLVGLRFQAHIPYADVQALASPPRVLR